MDVSLKKSTSYTDFEKIGLLGAGSCGKVCLVKNKTTQCAYAMKILKKKNNDNKLIKALNEQRVLAHIDHPFVAKLFFCFQSKMNVYIVMQYCAGGDFYNVLKRQPNNCLTEDQTKFYSSCVLVALEYLHLQGIVYRDLKPENILMHESGHIVLTDFDLSICSHDKVISKSFIKPYSHCCGVCSEPDIKCSGQVGTAEYMAPEVIDNKNYSAIIDWWSFGILLFEMLYGDTPFRGKTANDTFKLIHECNLKIPKYTPNNIKLNYKTKDLIKHLLVHNPAKRLGFNGGSTEIKDHPYFHDVKFPLLKNQTPPIIPTLSGKYDYHYFDAQSPNYTIGDTTDVIDPSMLQQDDVWKAFDNINRCEVVKG